MLSDDGDGRCEAGDKQKLHQPSGVELVSKRSKNTIHPHTNLRSSASFERQQAAFTPAKGGHPTLPDTTGEAHAGGYFLIFMQRVSYFKRYMSSNGTKELLITLNGIIVIYNSVQNIIK